MSSILRIVGTLETPEKKDAVVHTAVADLLRATGGDSTVALAALMKEAGKTIVKSERSTVASRKAKYRRILDEYDEAALVELETMTAGLLGRIVSNDLHSESGVLPDDQIETTMREHLDCQTVVEVLDVRAKERKAALFRHIDQMLAAEGNMDPEHSNGSIEVPALGKRFAREAAEPGPPTVDEGKLRVLLGEDLWKQVCTIEHIPAQTNYHLNIGKVLDMADTDNEVRTHLIACLQPGVARPRLVTRDISAEE